MSLRSPQRISACTGYSIGSLWSSGRLRGLQGSWAATQDREGASPGQALLMCKLPNESVGSINGARPARIVMWRSLIQHCAHPCHNRLGTCTLHPLETRAYCALRALASQDKYYLSRSTLSRAGRQKAHLHRHIKSACWRAAGRRFWCSATAKHRIVFLGTPEVSVDPRTLLCRPAIEPEIAVASVLDAALWHDR